MIYSYSNVELSLGAWGSAGALQAGTVIVSGGSDGTGPWALETTLQRTNEILNSISGKIDSIKGSSGSSNDSPVSGSGKKKIVDIVMNP